jgi:MYXO-CTERM domain-containing protein
MKWTFALPALMLVSAVSGTAATVTFEGFGGNSQLSGPTDSDGYTFSSSVSHFHFGNGLVGVPSNGTSILLQDRNATITMTQVGGGAFDLLGADFGEDVSFSASATSIRVIGFFVGGGSTSFDVALDGNSSLFETVLLSGFTNLSSATFTGLGGSQEPNANGFTLDNIQAQASAVPEPSSVALALIGLAALTAGRLRRRSS